MSHTHKKTMIILFYHSHIKTAGKRTKLRIMNYAANAFPFLFGKEIKDHVLVNNWANGWLLPNDTNTYSLVIVFLPQYLEYFGFILFIGMFMLFSIPWLRGAIGRRVSSLIQKDR